MRKEIIKRLALASERHNYYLSGPRPDHWEVDLLLAMGLGAEQAKDLHIANTGASLLEGDPDRGWELRRWVSDPLGGAHLLDVAAHDITGEGTEDAEAEALDHH